MLSLAFYLEAQTKSKDTIYFELDKKYIFSTINNPHTFYLRDGNGFFFESKEKIYNLKKTKTISLKKFIKKSKFYSKNRLRKLKDYDLAIYLQNYTIFLVDKRENQDVFIKVLPNFEID